MSLGIRHIALLAAAATLAACGSSADDGPADAGSSAAASAAPGSDEAGAAGVGEAGEAGGAAGGSTAGPGDTAAGTRTGRRNADGSPLVLTGTQLCADVPKEAAAQALGLEIQSAAPGDTATPQCTYSYTNAGGTDSAFTLAAMRPADIGGRTGIEAFDYVVELSRGLAGPVELDQEDLAVGDKAVRITGGQIHTGVVASGGHLLTVTVPESDAPAGAVDALVTEVARALA